MVEEGKIAKNFCLEGIDPWGRESKFCLQDFLKKGKILILYFYPRDNTSGCTKEATGFRDVYPDIKKSTFIIGISPDSIKSHKGFMEKHHLNFHLLSDPERKILSEYGAYGEKKMYGKIRMGVIRSTFIISPEGKVLRVWRNVRLKGHIEEVVDYIKSL